MRISLQLCPVGRRVFFVFLADKFVASMLVGRVLEVPQTHPAKMIVALLAVHMVAATVLVDSALAFGAFFRVLDEPAAGSSVLGVLLPPIPDLSAISRCVGLIHAHKAPLMANGANNICAEAALIERVLDPHSACTVRRLYQTTPQQVLPDVSMMGKRPGRAHAAARNVACTQL